MTITAVSRDIIIENVIPRDQHRVVSREKKQTKTKGRLFYCVCQSFSIISETKTLFSLFLPFFFWCFEDLLKNWELFFILRICLALFQSPLSSLLKALKLLKPFGSHHVCEHVVVVVVVVFCDNPTKVVVHKLECRVPFDEESFSKQKMSALRRECGVQISREKARRIEVERRRRDVSFSFRRDPNKGEEESRAADV